jgi:hypothetical protein
VNTSEAESAEAEDLLPKDEDPNYFDYVNPDEDAIEILLPRSYVAPLTGELPQVILPNPVIPPPGGFTQDISFDQDIPPKLLAVVLQQIRESPTLRSYFTTRIPQTSQAPQASQTTQVPQAPPIPRPLEPLKSPLVTMLLLPLLPHQGEEMLKQPHDP